MKQNRIADPVPPLNLNVPLGVLFPALEETAMNNLGPLAVLRDPDNSDRAAAIIIEADGTDSLFRVWRTWDNGQHWSETERITPVYNHAVMFMLAEYQTMPARNPHEGELYPAPQISGCEGQVNDVCPTRPV
jgi:hypothetical protein